MSIEQVFTRHDGVFSGSDRLSDALQVLSHTIYGTDDVHVIWSVVVLFLWFHRNTRCCRCTEIGIDVVEFSSPPGQRVLLKSC